MKDDDTVAEFYKTGRFVHRAIIAASIAIFCFAITPRSSFEVKTANAIKAIQMLNPDGINRSAFERAKHHTERFQQKYTIDPSASLTKQLTYLEDGSQILIPVKTGFAYPHDRINEMHFWTLAVGGDDAARSDHTEDVGGSRRPKGDRRFFPALTVPNLELVYSGSPNRQMRLTLA